MAAGGSMGGLGSTRTGQQPSQLNQQSAQPSSGGYQPSPLMFGQAYTPPPPAAPAPAPSNMNFNQRVSSFGGGFNGLVAANNAARQGLFTNSLYVNNPSANNNANAAPPQMPYQQVQAPAPQSPMYQTPETPPSGYRPSASAGQFYQPIYQSQYQNYNTGNPYGVSQYGMGYQSPFSGGYQPSFMGGYQQPMMGFNPYGGMGGYGQSPMGAIKSIMGGYNPQSRSDVIGMQQMLSGMGALEPSRAMTMDIPYGMRSGDLFPPGMLQRPRNQDSMAMGSQMDALRQALSNAQVRPSDQQQVTPGDGTLRPDVQSPAATAQIPPGMQNLFAQMLQAQQVGQQSQGLRPMTMDIRPGDVGSAFRGLGAMGGFGMNQGGIASLLKK